MNVLTFFVTACLVRRTTSTAPNPLTGEFDAMASVTRLIAEEHSANCIQIFRPDDPIDTDVQNVFRLWRLLADPESRTNTGVYSFGVYLRRKLTKPWKVSCYKPLKVLFGDDRTRSGYTHLTHNLRVKDSVWLLFLNQNFEDFLSEADLLFDCEVIVARVLSADLIHLYEVYRVRKDYPVRSSYYGNWTSSNGLDVIRDNMYNRRSNLERLVLRVGTLQNWPSTYLNGTRWAGFLMRIWYEMEELINCTSVFFESVDGMTGLRNPDYTWNGLVGMAVRGDIDIIVSEMTIEKTRSHALDLFHPIIYTSYQLYFRQLGYRLQWDSVFKPFGKSIWYAIIFWLLLGSTTISFCYYLSLFYGFEEDPEKVFSPSRSFFFILQTLSQQGHYSVPRSPACRMLFFLSYLVSAILIPSYSASLISYLTQQVPYRPFNTLEELHDDGRYKLLMKKNTAEYGYFRNAKSMLLKEIFRKQILTVPKDHEMNNASHAFKLLCSHPNYAFLGIEIIMAIRLGTTIFPDCPIIMTTSPISSIYLTMGAVKNSPYSGLINHHIMKMISSGVIKRIQNKELVKNYQEPPPPQREVALGEVFQMFVLIGASAGASILILFAEKRYYKFRHRKKAVTKTAVAKNGDVRVTMMPAVEASVMTRVVPTKLDRYPLTLLIHRYDGYLY